jgi:hypothetical protein
MKMVKRTLIAIALVAFLASVAPADIQVYYWGFDPDTGSVSGIDKDTGIKSDGNEKVYWPYEYKKLPICSIRVYMEIGMFVEVQDCKDKKIKMKQVDCSDIGKGGGDFPCYVDCESIDIRANFDVELFGDFVKNDLGKKVLDKWECFYDGGNVVPGDGANHTMKVCLKVWKAKLWESAGTYGEEIQVGYLNVTARPKVG